MRLEQLQAFLAIAETGSFQQAARNRHNRQSVGKFSHWSRLGLQLFHRTAQAKLTLGGALLRARKICHEWRNATEELARFSGWEAARTTLPQFTRSALITYPQFCNNFVMITQSWLRVTSLGSDRALKVLKDGLVDLAIVMNNRFLTTSPEMVVEVLYDEPIEVLMAANHPLLAQYEWVPGLS